MKLSILQKRKNTKLEMCGIPKAIVRFTVSLQLFENNSLAKKIRTASALSFEIKHYLICQLMNK
ncbi:hypothetical protein CW304_09255 [Bacillus sp. UFRGS-B20]|nr:hypothetical protein CW304_09255 [Bacillus sp. UFRGS-B20]